MTPLSRSVVLASLRAAHRRLAQDVGVAAALPDPAGAGAVLWDNRPLAALVAAWWGQPPVRVAHLLGLPAVASQDPGQGRAAQGRAAQSRAAKTAAPWAAETALRVDARRQWRQRVFAMSWTQAQILHVMEEIEPLVTAAWFDEQRLAAAAVGSYAVLLDTLQARHGDAADALLLDVVGGLESPAGALVADLAAGLDGPALRERYGYHADHALELAAPRWAELDDGGGLVGANPEAAAGAWQLGAAGQRREQTTSALISQAGLLQRGAMRSTIMLVQEALAAHTAARDSLSQVLATVRRWSLAAAREGLKDGRLDEPGDIFWLELEEIKQMMTGEWHSRDQVYPLVRDRRQAAPEPEPATARPLAAASPLGVAGALVRGQAVAVLTGEDAATVPIGAVALAASGGPGWSRLFLRAAGVVVGDGDLLCDAAAAGRAGGVPTVVAAAGAMAGLPSGEVVVDPPRHRIAA